MQESEVMLTRAGTHVVSPDKSLRGKRCMQEACKYAESRSVHMQYMRTLACMYRTQGISRGGCGGLGKRDTEAKEMWVGCLPAQAT